VGKKCRFLTSSLFASLRFPWSRLPPETKQKKHTSKG
jgi:hypothetical protein